MKVIRRDFDHKKGKAKVSFMDLLFFSVPLFFEIITILSYFLSHEILSDS